MTQCTMNRWYVSSPYYKFPGNDSYLGYVAKAHWTFVPSLHTDAPYQQAIAMLQDMLTIVTVHNKLPSTELW